MNLCDLGWNAFFDDHSRGEGFQGLAPARVIEELRGLYKVHAADGEHLAEIAGRLRYLARDRGDFPAVGDWVGIASCSSESRAQIEAVFPRRTKLSRKVAGRAFTEQIVAANVDTVFVVTSLNNDLNVRRIERYIAIVWESGARPVVLLNKADLCADPAGDAAKVEIAAPGVQVHSMSASRAEGLEIVLSYIGPGETGALIGSSGVGKTSIINALMAHERHATFSQRHGQLRVQPVRDGDDRGRHTTTSRQMIFLPGGGILIDTPGMREIQLWETNEGLEKAFEDIEQLASSCKFRDCNHRGEPGCAVESAILGGQLEGSRLENYRKLEAERNFQRRKTDPEFAQEVKGKWKIIHRAARDKGN